ncbi:MAG: hypothetical protein IKB34_08485, partial [Clostridia bacterium]|nr:hypothetical protein [Clostridia bacterium]
GRKKIIRPQLPAEPQIPDYERLYEPEKREFSHEIAKQIESESWKTTDMLLGAFSDDEKGDEFDSRSNGGGAQSALTDESPIDASSGFGKATPQQAESPLLGGSEDDRSGNSGEAADHRVNPGDSAQKKPKKTDLTKEGLRFLLQGRVSDFRALAIESGILPETLADRINELAIDSYGDIGISSADGFKVIEDYREELLELISG